MGRDATTRLWRDERKDEVIEARKAAGFLLDLRMTPDDETHGHQLRLLVHDEVLSEVAMVTDPHPGSMRLGHPEQYPAVHHQTYGSDQVKRSWA